MNALAIIAGVVGVLWYVLLSIVTARWLYESLPHPLGERLSPAQNLAVVTICVFPIAVPVFLMMCAATGIKFIKTKLF